MLGPSLFALLLIGVALDLARRLFFHLTISAGEEILILYLAWVLLCGALILRLACVYDFCPLFVK
jgi:hypothetical protein